MSSEVFQRFTLFDVVDEFIDYRGKTPRKTTEGIPLITAKIVKDGFISPANEFIAVEDYDAWMTRGIPQSGDVVITTEAPLGEVAQIKATERIALAQRLITLRGRKGILDNGYLKYSLMTSEMQGRLKERSSGSTVNGIKSSELKKVLIDLPSYQEQCEISAILSCLDDKIELNNRMNKTLEEMAQAIFKSWFVDFNPFKDGEFVDSELGRIPEGWTCCPIKDIVADYIGGDWGQEEPSSEYSDEVQCIRGADFPAISSGSCTSVPLRFLKGSSLKRRQLLNDDIVLEISGGTKGRPVGRTVYISEALLSQRDLPMIFSNFCRLIRCKNEMGLITYLHIQRQYAIGQIEKYQVQSTGIANFQFMKFLDDFRIVVPPEAVIAQFNELVRPLYGMISGNDSENLKNIRDTLLPKLMSGEIRVPIQEE